MGLAARFTLGIGIFSLLVAAPATWILIATASSQVREAAEDARIAMARTTGELRARGARIPPELKGRQLAVHGGIQVLGAEASLSTDAGERRARIYRVRKLEEGAEADALDLFAPPAGAEPAEFKLFVLVLLVTGGLVLTVVLVGAGIGRKVAAPVKVMIQDVSAISHGRFDHPIRADEGAREVKMLARATNRMVHDLLEGQESQRQLEKRQREVEILREFRRNLKPMTVEAPAGFALDTRLIEARGAGTGDFVDALRDEAGRPTLVVGGTAARGMPGALLMAMARAYLRGAILRGLSPAEACGWANASLNRDLETGLYASAIVMRLDPEEESAALVSAGHKAPAVRWDAAHGQWRKIQPNGIALGFDAGPIFHESLEEVKIPLGPGDAVFLFSPAAFECANAKGRVLGEKGVYSLAKLAVEQDLESMEKKLLGFLGGQPQSDLAFALLRRHA